MILEMMCKNRPLVSEMSIGSTQILFVCVHNAGRSQMAEAYLNHLAQVRGVKAVASSAGTLQGGTLNPVAVEVMAEDGVSLVGHFPKSLTQDMANEADVIVSMGCGVDAAACPAKFLVTEDWGLDDPAGQPIEVVRSVRDQVRSRVEQLLDELKDRS